MNATPKPKPRRAEQQRYRVLHGVGPRSVRKLATRRFSHGSRAGNRLELQRPLSSLRPDLMLPITVQFLVAMLAYGLNERRARKADYLREENRILKEALQAATGKRSIL